MEQHPRLRQLQQVDPHAVRMLRRVRTVLEPHADEVRPRDLDMAAFIIFNTVESFTHVALTGRPEYLTRESYVEVCDDIVAMRERIILRERLRFYANELAKSRL